MCKKYAARKKNRANAPLAHSKLLRKAN